jgi:hypothetical protein
VWSPLCIAHRLPARGQYQLPCSPWSCQRGAKSYHRFSHSSVPSANVQLWWHFPQISDRMSYHEILR